MADSKDDTAFPSLEAHETDTSDRETDNFEDAPDSHSVRSLTKRRPSANHHYHRSSSPSVGGASELQQAFQKIRGRKSTAGEDDTDKENKKDGLDADSIDPESPSGHQRRPSAIPNIDISSNGLDTVSLDDDTAKASALDTAPPPPEKDAAAKTLSLGSITNAIPSMPWSPSAHGSDSPTKPPVSPGLVAASGAPPAHPTRKLTSPFSWLSRGSTKETPATSPPPSQVTGRRNTTSSIATLASNPEMMLSKLEEEGDPRAGTGRASLKDRFKMIRMREEAGITSLPSEEETAEDGTVSPVAIGSPVKSHATLSVPLDASSEQASSPALDTNPAMAPGTASGVTAGPSSVEGAVVDWDLWQNVITEGPAAVARSSPEELNKAIATGIPNAIRGVIWQVLAQSKNEDLEAVYHDLVIRGTDKEKEQRASVAASAASNKEAPSSSASSVHSGESGAASKETNGASATPATTEGVDTPVAPSIASAEKEVDNAADRKKREKREKEDAALLHKLEKTIKRDLGARTSYSKFAAAQGLQDGLFGVCKAYALFDEGVGYAQGMNFLIMPLLFNMPEEEAFCLLVRLMNQYQLRDLFIQDMPGLHMHLYLFERLLEDLEPALYCHLHRKNISPHLYATQWFLTLFAYRFPLQLVLRIYDLILSEGLSAILKFGIVLMQKNAATLLAMSDMAQLTTFLKDRLFDVYIDASPSAGSLLENGFFGSSSSSLDKEVYRADQFVLDACEVKLTPELVKAYTAEWEEKTRAEKEREAEVDGLRQSNASLAAQVRKLEERIEAADAEQAMLATEVVRTKVRDEELQDENESLKGQVRELKVVIEKQPEELEQAWQLERDDLMARNAKVHEENQRVEKEMAELEEELVKTKLKYAEVNEQHESLSRRWAEMKRQFMQ